MMDLDESMRALYSAPVPLIVLERNRRIKLLNRSAEELLGISIAKSAGERLERYIAPPSHPAFTSALNKASQDSASTAHGHAPSLDTRLELSPRQGQSSRLWVGLSVSAWFPTDAIFNFDDEEEQLVPDDDTSISPTGSMDKLRPSTLSSESLSPVRAPHEAHFTISVMPSMWGSTPDSSLSEHSLDTAKILQNSIFDHIDQAVVALSKDGKTEIRNRACDAILTALTKSDVAHPNGIKEGRFNLPFIAETVTLFDENFEKEVSASDWPICRCAFHGQSMPPTAMGLESKWTGERMVVEMAAHPIRDQARHGGQHIGGMLTFHNMTAEREKLKREANLQGELHFRQAVDIMPQLNWIAAPNGYVQWYSKSFLQYTGSSAHETEGAGWQGLMHENEVEEVSRRWSHSLRYGEPLETASRLRRHDGVWRWFLSRAMPMVDPSTGQISRWFGTCTDIHDQVGALSASRRTQIQLETVINHAAITLWAVDRSGKITAAEGPGVRQLKLTKSGSSSSRDESSPQSQSEKGSRTSAKEEMVGQSIYDVWDLTNVSDSMNKALQGETVVGEMQVDGRWYRTSYTPLRAQGEGAAAALYGGSGVYSEDVDKSQGEVVGVVGASMDVTDRKHAQELMEESLVEKTRALAAEGAAQEASRLKSQFLANMSHEIRTPIAGIIGLSEQLLDEELAAHHREHVQTLQTSAEGLLTVINDVLDFSKVEVGKLDMEQSPFDLKALLRDSTKMISFAARKKGLELRHTLKLGSTGALIGDVGRLRQVITNLLSNALKFTSQGRIDVDVEALSEDASHTVISIDIRDTGCGVGPDARSRLFQPFSQADPSTARRFGGTGLGLTISKNLVELMGGTIGFDSTQGQGSHVWFTVPFPKATAHVEEGLRNQHEGAGVVSNFQSPRARPDDLVEANVSTECTPRPRKEIWVLIAEDNEVNARIAARNVEKMGFSCQTVEDGILALEELEGKSYDAVLMDCQMPRCDGYEATRLIRKSPNADIRSLPIIALTASAIKGDREKALNAGMDDYLAKPVRRPSLESALCKWLFGDQTQQDSPSSLSTQPPKV